MCVTMNKVTKLVLILMVFGLPVQAQKKNRTNKPVDTLATLREFMLVCNAYKELPLKLELKLINTSNFISSPEDTMQTEAEFYLQKTRSYARFGDVEQFANDSVALVVSNKLQRMILYPDAQAMVLQIKAMTGLQMKDSSIAELAKKYKAQTELKGNDTAYISLVNRQLLSGTSIPREMLEVKYHPVTKEPFEIKATKNTLIPLQSEDYNTLKAVPELADKLINSEEKGSFLVKEQVSTFVYSRISHDPSIQLPVFISGRVVREEGGEYVPAKGYENYRLIVY